MSASDQPANPGRARTTSRLRWIVGFSILGLILALGAVIFLEADSTSSGWAPGTIFVANDNNTLTVIRPDRSIRTTIKLSGAPFGLAIAPPGTPNAGTVYVSNPNGLDVIEPGSAKITSHVALPCTPKVKVRGPSSEGICGAGGLSADLVVAPAGAPNAGTVYVGGNWTSFGAATIGHTEGKVWAYVPGKSTVSTITFPDPLMTLAIAPQGASNVGTVYSATETQALSSITATTQVVQTHALSQADGTYTFLGVAPTGTPSVGDVYLWRNRYPTEVVQILHGGSTANVKSTTIPAQVNTAEVAPLGAPNAGVTYLAAESTYSQQIIRLNADGSVGSSIDDGDNIPQGLSGISNIAVAPRGTRNGGTAYVTHGSAVGVSSIRNKATLCAVLHDYVSVIAPGAATESHIGTVGMSFAIAFAPAGTPNAGTAYIATVNDGCGRGTNSLSVIAPTAPTVSATIPLGGRPLFITVAP